MKYECDLHCHTTRSDGGDTPEELIINAKKAGLKVVAITDHDRRPPTSVVRGDEEWEIEKYAQKQKIKLLRGIEISCETEVEDVHILCFGCAWEDIYFVELEEKTVQSKVESYKELVARLNKGGITISWEEILDNGGNRVPEKEIQKKMIFERMAQRGYAGTWNEAKLLVKGDACYQVKRQKPDPMEVIEQVHRLGGIAVLAHPLLIDRTVRFHDREIKRDDYIKKLFEAGLDGIEACYAYSKTSYGGTLTDEEARRYVFEHYGALASIISGGSDYHADHKKGVSNARRLGECGVTYEYFRGNELLASLIE